MRHGFRKCQPVNEGCPNMIRSFKCKYTKILSKDQRVNNGSYSFQKLSALVDSFLYCIKQHRCIFAFKGVSSLGLTY